MVNWDFAKFSSSTKAEKEKNFKSPMLGIIDVCATLVDSEGRIFAWILPDIVSESHMVSLSYRIDWIPLTGLDTDSCNYQNSGETPCQQYKKPGDI